MGSLKYRKCFLKNLELHHLVSYSLSIYLLIEDTKCCFILKLLSLLLALLWLI